MPEVPPLRQPTRKPASVPELNRTIAERIDDERNCEQFANGIQEDGIKLTALLPEIRKGSSENLETFTTWLKFFKVASAGGLDERFWSARE